MISRHMCYIKIIIEFVILDRTTSQVNKQILFPKNKNKLFLNNQNNIQESSLNIICIFENPAFALSVLFLQMDYFFVVMLFLSVVNT